jgi:hypothetical protein
VAGAAAQVKRCPAEGRVRQRGELLTAGCADVDPGMSCMHNRLNRLFGGTVCMYHAIRVNHTEIRCSGGLLIFERNGPIAPQEEPIHLRV